MPGPRAIPISCARCGAGLEIEQDMNSISCGYCGTHLKIERRGGTVALREVTDAIHRVQLGTDRTSSELAIKRLRDELIALNHDRQTKLTKLHDEHWSRLQLRKTSGVIAILIAIIATTSFVVTNSSIGFGVLSLIIGFFSCPLAIHEWDRRLRGVCSNNSATGAAAINATADEHVARVNRELTAHLKRLEDHSV